MSFKKPSPTTFEQRDGTAPLGSLAPAADDVPAEFSTLSTDTARKWDSWYSGWVADGIDHATLTPRAGVETVEAMRHLTAIINSPQPEAEKRATIAWLASLWFK